MSTDRAREACALFAEALIETHPAFGPLEDVSPARQEAACDRLAAAIWQAAADEAKVIARALANETRG